MKYTLSDLRKSLDNLDEAIVVLLAERFRLTDKVGWLKAKQGLSAQDKKREEEKFEKLSEIAKSHGLDPSFVKKLFRMIIDEVIKRHKEINSKFQIPNSK